MQASCHEHCKLVWSTYGTRRQTGWTTCSPALLRNRSKVSHDTSTFDPRVYPMYQGSLNPVEENREFPSGQGTHTLNSRRRHPDIQALRWLPMHVVTLEETQ
jgi:hypothetical protein